jgi:hypothetical protein
MNTLDILFTILFFGATSALVCMIIESVVRLFQGKRSKKNLIDLPSHSLIYAICKKYNRTPLDFCQSLKIWHVLSDEDTRIKLNRLLITCTRLKKCLEKRYIIAAEFVHEMDFIQRKLDYNVKIGFPYKTDFMLGCLLDTTTKKILTAVLDEKLAILNAFLDKKA